MAVGRWLSMIKLKRAYEPATNDDGLRILVERLWPRDVSKQMAKIDLWLKDLSPSTELRMLGFISSSFASTYPLEWRTSLHESDHLG